MAFTSDMAAGAGRILVTASIAVATLLPALDAAACTRVEQEFVVDPALAQPDDEPPVRFAELSALVFRRRGELCGLFECTANSCGDDGTVQISFARPGAQPETIGARIDVIDGTLPASMTGLPGRLLPVPAGASTVFLDVAFGDVPDLNVLVTLTAVDRAGNESEPSEPVHLVWSGCTREPANDTCIDEGGCSVASPGAGGRSGWLGLALALALAALTHRRPTRS